LGYANDIVVGSPILRIKNYLIRADAPTADFYGQGNGSVYHSDGVILDKDNEPRNLVVSGNVRYIGRVKHLATIWTNNVIYPASSPATVASRNGHPVINFDDTSEEYIEFHFALPNDYLGGGSRLTLMLAAATATSGDAIFRSQWERVGFEVQDLDADGWGSIYGFDSLTMSSTSGFVKAVSREYTTAQMDGALAGEWVRLRIWRYSTYFLDTVVGDVQLVGAILESI
jgi:hypothetical protein